MRKPAFCICENKDADQLCNNCAADQRLCFRYTDSTIPLLLESEISSLYPSSMALQPGLCGTRSKTPKTGFLTTRLNYNHDNEKTVLFTKYSRKTQVFDHIMNKPVKSTYEQQRCRMTYVIRAD